MKTIGTGVPNLLNCNQKPTFNLLNLVISTRAAMFITITVYSAPHARVLLSPSKCTSVP